MSFSTALSGLNAAQTNLDVVSNNIANSNTHGFKGSRVEFADVYAVSQSGGTQNSVGKGVRVAAVNQQFTQGDIELTENNLDLAITGKGFFRLNENGATVYSRAGAFGLDREGFIVNSSSQRLTGYQAALARIILGKEPYWTFFYASTTVGEVVAVDALVSALGCLLSVNVT